MKTFLFVNDCVISIPLDMKYDCAYTDDVSSITITHEEVEYEIVYNKKADWTRLLINDRKTGEWKDLPFHSRTYRFLPEGVEVSEDEHGE